jgi:hypothetical protein
MILSLDLYEIGIQNPDQQIENQVDDWCNSFLAYACEIIDYLNLSARIYSV